MRALKIMLRLFLEPMRREVWIDQKFVTLLFPSLEEVMKVHGRLQLMYNALFYSIFTYSSIICLMNNDYI